MIKKNFNNSSNLTTSTKQKINRHTGNGLLKPSHSIKISYRNSYQKSFFFLDSSLNLIEITHRTYESLS